LTELQSIGSNSQVVLSFRCPFMGTNLLTCHTIILYVSYDDGTGSDEAAWFYSPTGSFEDCISLQADAGVGDGGSTSQDD